MSLAICDNLVEPGNRINLTSVKHQLCEPHPGDLRLAPELAELAIDLYRKFLTLCAELPVIPDGQTDFHPHQTLVASRAVDWVQHYHVLDMTKFEADCAGLGLPLVHFSHGRTMLSDEQWMKLYIKGTVEPFMTRWGIDLIAESESIFSGGGEPASSFDFLGGSKWLRRPVLPTGS